jgi:acyl-CoA synthetase (AMP-forming)/AMP-acid ligase II
MNTDTPGGAESRATAVEDANHRPARATITAQRPRTVIMSAGSSRTPSGVLAHLLKMADGYLAAHAVHQAMAIYFEVFEKHGGTQEAGQAHERLLEIADHCEKAGEFHQARSIYERML